MMKREMDYSLLKGIIASTYGTQSALAKKMMWRKEYLSQKLHSKFSFSQAEILDLADALEIEDEMIGKVFFSQNVEK